MGSWWWRCITFWTRSIRRKHGERGRGSCCSLSWGFYELHGQLWALVLYLLIPWSGVMALGYAFGAVVSLPAEKRRSRCVQLGLAALAVFAELRFTHAYGDPVPFQRLKTGTQTMMSFLNVTKYPPSLEFVCVTLGFLLLLFAMFDWMLNASARRRRRWMWWEVYGRVPFFYYVIHFYTLHILAVVVLMVAMHTVHVKLPMPIYSACRRRLLRVLAGGGLRHLAGGGRCAVSAVPVVRRREGTAEGDWWLSYL